MTRERLFNLLTAVIALVTIGAVVVLVLTAANVDPGVVAAETTAAALTRDVIIPVAAPTDDQALKLAAITVVERPDALDAVTITVRNVTSRPQSGVMWYVLTPNDAPIGLGAPAAYTATRESIDALPPGEALTVTLPGPAAALIGAYRLSVWAHHRGGADGGLTHSDGVTDPRVITLGPALALTIDAVATTFADDDLTSLIDVGLTVINNIPQTATVGLSYTIHAAGTADAGGDQTAVFTLPLNFVTVPPVEARAGVYSAAVPLPDGDYRLAVALYRVIDGDLILIAEVDYTDPITIRAPAPELPELRFAIEDASWSFNEIGNQATMDVTLSVTNDTPEPASVGLSYSLAAPDDPTPWQTGVFTLPFRFVEVATGSTYTITHTDEVVLAEGDYALTGYLHQVVDGEQRQIAEVEYAEQIEVVFAEADNPRLNYVIENADWTVDPAREAVTLEITMTVTNNTPETQRVGLSYSLSTPQDMTPWQTGVFTLPFRFVDLASGGTYTFTHTEAIALPDGFYKITGYLHQVVGEEQIPLFASSYPDFMRVNRGGA
ncbi:MAG: hypothetical protein GYB67_15360 [Chloroflexi bacterium]|nr:hypothetical protein [Chloroflexota bacterium]